MDRPRCLRLDSATRGPQLSDPEYSSDSAALGGTPKSLSGELYSLLRERPYLQPRDLPSASGLFAVHTDERKSLVPERRREEAHLCALRRSFRVLHGLPRRIGAPPAASEVSDAVLSDGRDGRGDRRIIRRPGRS